MCNGFKDGTVFPVSLSASDLVRLFVELNVAETEAFENYLRPFNGFQSCIYCLWNSVIAVS